MSDLIRLPSERVTQLRQLSRNLGLTVSDTIAYLLNQQIEAGHLTGNVPGFVVANNDEGKVSIAVECPDGRIEGTADKESALLIADRMEQAASKQHPFPAAEDVWLVVSRVGAGVKLSSPGGKFERMVAPSLARDVASLIRKAAGPS